MTAPSTGSHNLFGLITERAELADELEASVRGDDGQFMLWQVAD
jgi:hypothetical protein